MSLVLLFAFALGGAPAAPGQVHWEHRLEDALKKAKASGKPVLIDFWAEWCGWCHRLDQTTYVDPAVTKLIGADFVALKIDTEAGPRSTEIAARYGVQSLPTIAFLSPSGRLIDRVDSYQGPGPFARTLESVHTRGSKVIAWESALDKDPQDSAALFQLGMHMFEQEAYEESGELLRRAAESDAKRPVSDRKQTRMLIGIIERYNNRFGNAEAVLKEGLALEPATEYDPKMLYVLGRVYAAWNKTPEARVALTRVLVDYPGSSVTVKARELLISLGH
ncbi:MAG TPA: thioredoxin family protein [Vicinamibacteria bacterium]|nr:thioredoxin family protein [Vicinamibacteria bacterium]